MLWLFGSTLFISSALLFWIQPLFSKMALPLLGGSPSVWNTSMVFYQAALFGGYAFTHFCTQRFGARRHSIVHLILIGIALYTLPFIIPKSGPSSSDDPVLWLFVLHLKSIGLPFAVLTCSAPMLQKWFERTGHPNANDPYFLYAASNAGSLLALLAYPLLLEPLLSLARQRNLWTLGYALLAAMISINTIVLWRSAGGAPLQTHPITEQPSPAITTAQRIRWLLLAFAPSSLLLGVTTYITTDIAAIPLLWVIPLTIYLLTFIITFSRRPIVSHVTVLKTHSYLVLPPVLLFFSPLKLHAALDFPIHLIAFFLAAMVCHGELVKSRPHSTRLTEFYLWISLGGLCGGLLNGLFAPIVFDRIIEYPMAIILACTLRPKIEVDTKRIFARNVVFGLFIALLILLIGPAIHSQAAAITFGLLGLALAASVIGWYAINRIRQPILIGILFLILTPIETSLTGGGEPIIYRDRSFFGPMRVRYDESRNCNLFQHGTTLHGVQSRDPARRDEPLSYYHRTGPFAQIVETLNRADGMKRAAVVGLGVGVIAAYGQSGQEITFYEIDPAVERIARDTRYFTFLNDTPAAIRIILGDARLKLGQVPVRSYDSIFMDAFSSGSVPVHLLTAEAMKIYVSKLSEDGFMVFQISNRYLDFEPILFELARESGMAGYIRKDLDISQQEKAEMKVASIWAVMCRRDDCLQPLKDDSRWRPLSNPRQIPLWTDDYSNILRVIKIPGFQSN